MADSTWNIKVILDMIIRFILSEPRYKSLTFQGGEGVVLAPMVVTVIQHRRSHPQIFPILHPVRIFQKLGNIAVILHSFHDILPCPVGDGEGYLTKQGIERIRSMFANDIFQDNLKSIYQQQTFTRDELKVLSENQMKEILSKIGSGTVDEKLVTAIEKLHGQLQTAKGKKVYGYLPKEIKQTVDEIFSLLADDEHIKELYEKWCELESLKYKTYTLKPKTFPPLTENKEFRSVKNMIIRTVLEMDKPMTDEPEPAPPEPTDDDDTPPPIDYGDELSPDDFIFNSTDAVEADVSDFTPPSKYM